MNFAITVLCLFCVVYSTSARPTVDSNSNREEFYLRVGEACFVQYLQDKGKLDRSFRAEQSPLPTCRQVLPASINNMNAKIRVVLQRQFPNDVDCLYREFVNRNGADDAIKVTTIEINTILSASERATQLAAANQALEQIFEDIGVTCNVDKDRLVEETRRK